MPHTFSLNGWPPLATHLFCLFLGVTFHQLVPEEESLQKRLHPWKDFQGIFPIPDSVFADHVPIKGGPKGGVFYVVREVSRDRNQDEPKEKLRGPQWCALEETPFQIFFWEKRWFVRVGGAEAPKAREGFESLLRRQGKLLSAKASQSLKSCESVPEIFYP